MDRFEKMQAVLADDLDYIRQTAWFLMEAHSPDMALDNAEVFSRLAFEKGDFAHHQFWKFVFDAIEIEQHHHHFRLLESSPGSFV